MYPMIGFIHLIRWHHPVRQALGETHTHNTCIECSKAYGKLVSVCNVLKTFSENEQKKMLKSGTDKENKRNDKKERNAWEHKNETKERGIGITHTEKARERKRMGKWKNHKNLSQHKNWNFHLNRIQYLIVTHIFNRLNIAHTLILYVYAKFHSRQQAHKMKILGYRVEQLECIKEIWRVWWAVNICGRSQEKFPLARML